MSTETSAPERIYLQPECCATPDVGRMWCEHDEPVECEDGVRWTEYAKVDTSTPEGGAVRELIAEIVSQAPGAHLHDVAYPDDPPEDPGNLAWADRILDLVATPPEGGDAEPVAGDAEFLKIAIQTFEAMEDGGRYWADDPEAPLEDRIYPSHVVAALQRLRTTRPEPAPPEVDEVVTGALHECPGCGTIVHVDAATPEVEAMQEIDEQGWSLVARDVPTGGDDWDVMWEVIEHYMSKPHKRIVGSGRTPMEALRDALTESGDTP